MSLLQTYKEKLRKPAIAFQVGGFRPPENLLASWIGKICVGLPHETWPVSNGKPMLPLVQINLKALEYIPDNLSDIEYLVVFIDAEHLPSDSDNGNHWVIRTYSDCSKLVELQQPNLRFAITPFPLQAKYIDDDFPCYEDCPVELPDELDDAYYDLFQNTEGLKLGGWPTLVQSEIFWAPNNAHPDNPEFVFQIDSCEKANWSWGDQGVAYIGRGTKTETKNNWVLSWQCL